MPRPSPRPVLRCALTLPHRLLRLLAFALPALLAAWPARATLGGGSLPWNQPLDTLQQNITGPTMTAILFIAVAVGVGVWGFSERSEGIGRAGKALAALAIVGVLGAFLTTLGISFAVV